MAGLTFSEDFNLFAVFIEEIYLIGPVSNLIGDSVPNGSLQ